MRKLRSYCRERIAQLKEEEKTQKELRIYCRYSRLPKLPTEIIVRILSTLESGTGSTLNTQIPKAISVEACGLLPQLILKPCLVLPPYCKNFDTKRTLVAVGSKSLEISILTDPDVSRSVSLSMEIKHWKIVVENKSVLRSLLRVPHRWRRLQLFFSGSGSISPVLESVRPCFQYIKDLTICCSSEAQLFPHSIEPIVTGSIETIHIGFCLLSCIRQQSPWLRQETSLVQYGYTQHSLHPTKSW